MNIIKSSLLFMCLLLSYASWAQETEYDDSTAVEAVPSDTTLTDSLHYFDEPEDYDEDYYAEDAQATPAAVKIKDDHSSVEARAFNDSTLQSLREDAEMDYRVDSPASRSFWSRLMRKLNNAINDMFYWSDSSDYGRLFIYFILGLLLVFVILKLLRVDALKIFYNSANIASPVKYAVLDENIHEMNFDELIQKALDKKEFRLAVRLTFLRSLKMLSDHHHVYWEPGKTNHDYLRELKTKDLQSGFAKLNYYFEYAWYGNFAVTQDTYKQVNELYNRWKENIR